MNKFQPGDLAIIVGFEGPVDQLGVMGKVVTVVGPPIEGTNDLTGEGPMWVYPVDLDIGSSLRPDQFVGFRAEHLKPIHDGDGTTASSWEDGVWQPTELVRVSCE